MRLPDGFTGLLVATPCFGGLATNGYLQSLLRLALGCRDQKVTCEIVTSPGDSLVTRARNTLTAVFLASKHSHLLFIDADIEFHPKDALRLLRADKDLVCGLYPKKSIEPEWPLNWLPGSRERLNVCPTTGAIEILEGPTGFMMIRRTVFERMIDAHPEWKYVGPSFLSEEQQAGSYAFFDAILLDGHYLSEDFAFCRRWRDLGGQVWMLPQIELRHHGMHGFSGSVTQCLATGPADSAELDEQEREVA